MNITSTQNPKVKLARSLMNRSKERHEAGAFCAEGVRLVEEALLAEWPMKFVLYSRELSMRGRELLNQLEAKNIEVEQVPDSLLNTISETRHSQGILAVLEYFSLPIPRSPDFILIVDQVRDPGNLGTLLRAAMAAGVQAILLPPETTDAFAPKVVRAGMGAHFRVPIHSQTWEQIHATTRNLRIHLAETQGISCWETDFRIPLGLIVGGEANGATKQARELADQVVCIPMPGKAESLNAGVAGAILLFEVVRQRQSFKR